MQVQLLVMYSGIVAPVLFLQGASGARLMFPLNLLLSNSVKFGKTKSAVGKACTHGCLLLWCYNCIASISKVMISLFRVYALHNFDS